MKNSPNEIEKATCMLIEEMMKRKKEKNSLIYAKNKILSERGLK